MKLHLLRGLKGTQHHWCCSSYANLPEEQGAVACLIKFFVSDILIQEVLNISIVEATFCDSTVLQVGSNCSVTLNVTGTAVVNVWWTKKLKKLNHRKRQTVKVKNYQSLKRFMDKASLSHFLSLPSFFFSPVIDMSNSKEKKLKLFFTVYILYMYIQKRFVHKTC